MRTVLCVLTLLLALPGAAQEWGFEELMRQRAQVQSARAKFTEVRKVPSADSTTKSSGVLIYRAPDHLERQTTMPYEETAIVKNDRITLEFEVTQGVVSRREFALAQVPGMRPFFVALRALLAGDAETLQRTFRVEMQGTAAEWKMKLVPREGADQPVRDMQVAGRGDEIRSIELRQKNGDTLRTTLTPQSQELKTPAKDEPAPAGPR
jgi:outer membrane lipoprotein-sorting protein